MLSSSPPSSFWWSRICSPVDAEGLCKGGYRDTILLVHMSFCLGIRCFAFKSASIELNINKHFSLTVRRKIRCNKTANGVICDVLNWLSRGVLYFNLIVRFHGTHLNLIPFTSIRKARGFLLRQFFTKITTFQQHCAQISRLNYNKLGDACGMKRARKESGPYSKTLLSLRPYSINSQSLTDFYVYFV